MEQGIKTQELQDLTGKRVVIIEDEGITAMQLRKMMIRQGLLVVGMAYNGKEGVETVLRERPELVLSDINMPIMNGIEAAKQILAVYQPCIVFLTAYDEHREEVKRMGGCGYMIKPVTSDTLHPEIQRCYQQFVGNRSV